MDTIEIWGTRLYGDSLAKKDRTSISKNCDTAGIVFTPILYKGEFVSSKKPIKDSQKRSYRLTYGKNECVLTFFYRKLEG